MSLLELTILTLCAAIALFQVVICLKLVGAFLRPAPAPLSDEDCPPLLAVLCLRGTDPFLPRSLRQLFLQDYPEYRVRVVIDSPSDPVRELVEDVRDELGADHVEILTLAHHDEFCSAKMSSLLAATDQLPDDVQIVATFDGDCVLHSACLRELVTPLVRENVAVSTGNRWFAPPSLSVGAVARLQWNLACVPFMHVMGLPWGGCLAMQRAVIEDDAIRRRYGCAFAEDMLLGSVMRQRGERVRFVPQATIVNREDISLGGLLNFLTRQMLCVRLHHHQWRAILGWGILVTALCGIILPLGLLAADLRLACGIGLALLLVSNFVPMLAMGACVRRMVNVRGEKLVRFTPGFAAMLLLVAPLTQWLTLIANLRALFTRHITWRGLTYQFARSPRVRLVHEVPVQNLGIEFQLPAEEGHRIQHRDHERPTLPTAMR